MMKIIYKNTSIVHLVYINYIAGLLKVTKNVKWYIYHLLLINIMHYDIILSIKRYV